MNFTLKPQQKLPQHKNALGSHGEDVACSFLLSQKYSILDRNFRIRGGEIDIIAKKEGIVVFIEVKTRSSAAFGGAVGAITVKKINDIRKTGEYYLSLHKNLPYSYRIDVIAVTMKDDGSVLTLDHIENASF